MKNLKILYTLIFFLLMAVSCEQDQLIPEPPETVNPPDPCGENPTAGSIDLTNFIAIGNSLTAGFQAGALFDAGQQNSLPKILAKQFECVGGSSTFNQPDINSVNGYNATFSDPLSGIILGRLVLFDADGDGEEEEPLPTPSGAPGVPSPYNTAELLTAYTGDKSALNNFGVPGVKVIEATVANYGMLNPYFGRFASDPVNKSLLADAAEEQPTFFLMWLGINDVLAYAVDGASGSSDGTNPNDMTPEAFFAGAYSVAANAMLGASAKGVVGNIPDVTNLPYFTSVPWNAIEFDAEDPTAAPTVALLNSSFAGFNEALDGLVAAGFIASEDAAIRKVSYALGANPVLIFDEYLEDLGPYFDAMLGLTLITPEERAALAPYEQARPLTENELVTFPAALVLGELANPADPTTVFGVAVPMADEYILTETEIELIKGRTAAFNAIISSTVTNSDNRLALADVHSAYINLINNGAEIHNGVTVTAGLAPPTGLFSEDGIHPNSRGYAYTANIFINAINAKFGASIPLANVAAYSATGLPLNP